MRGRRGLARGARGRAGLVVLLGVCLLACDRSPGSRACVTQLTGHASYTCALLGSGEARCWGSRTGGYFDTEPEAVQRYPGRISRLFVDYYAFCVGVADGSLWCAENETKYTPRHLPEPRTGEPDKPPYRQPFRNVTHLAVGGRCALTADELLCWEDHSKPVPITHLPTKPTQLVGGLNHACVLLESGQVFCRGWNVRGELGILEGATEEERYKSRVTKYSRLTRVKALGDDTRLIAAGLDHSCALKRDGSVWCWGRNEYGELGKGDISICSPSGSLLWNCTPEEGLEPSRVDGLPADIRDLKLAFKTSCAIDGQGSAWCWGDVEKPTPRPVKLDVGAPVTALTFGDHWCALLRDGQVRCKKDSRALSWTEARTVSLGCP